MIWIMWFLWKSLEWVQSGSRDTLCERHIVIGRRDVGWLVTFVNVDRRSRLIVIGLQLLLTANGKPLQKFNTCSSLYFRPPIGWPITWATRPHFCNMHLLSSKRSDVGSSNLAHKWHNYMYMLQSCKALYSCSTKDAQVTTKKRNNNTYWGHTVIEAAHWTHLPV